ncbi:MAG: EAL domain-containing protein, partial [Leptospiraceae bacterium]|nr:EAL domain-containing protein [Leptospiraceae bacterium]
MQSLSWENRIQKGNLLPFFQPILSVESKSIYGYEVLGRLQIEGEVLSLGGFFMNPSISQMLKRETDRALRQKAIQLFSNLAPQNTKLFLNISPRLLLDYSESYEDELLFLLQTLKEFQLPPERIILEITEDSFEGGVESLRTILEEYKTRGFSYAIDDVGSNASNLDRIGTLEPDIIKIDMQLLKKSVVNRSYYEINLNLSQLAQSLGISLLYEGIETQEELSKCLNFGASLLQGFFFQEPQSFFHDCSQFTLKITKHISEALKYKKQKIENLIQWEQKIEALLDSFNVENHLKEDGQLVDYESIFVMDSNIKRLYVTDQYGNQISPNYTRTSLKQIQVDSEAIGKNWSWRPYFSNHIYESVKGRNAVSYTHL